MHGIVSLVGAAALAFLAAGCETDKKVAATKVDPQPVTVVGENYCLGCALKKSHGAAAQCSVYGHRHVLKVESASGADGQAIPALVGDSLHYLDNDKSAPLLKGGELHGKRVEVKGRLFAPQRTLEVTELKAL